jgi:hypothetical protein
VKVAKATHAALDQIELDPGIGSPTLGKRLGIPGLRTWRVGKFPLLWCYFERGDCLDVVRLLGERQDIAAILGDESPRTEGARVASTQAWASMTGFRASDRRYGRADATHNCHTPFQLV